MAGRRDDLKRSNRPEEVRTFRNNRTPSPELSDEYVTEDYAVDEYKGLYDGALIPRSGYNNYRHPNHFRLWKKAYSPYIKQLYVKFANAIVTPDNFENLSKATLPEFIEFVYRNSSGYISEYL